MLKRRIGIAALTDRLVIPEAGPVHWAESRIWDRWQEESRHRVGPIYQAQRKKVVDYLAHLSKPVTVLELCCGTGRLAHDLLGLENVTQLCAVDISPRAIAMLQTRLQDHPRASILQAEVANVLESNTWPGQDRYDVAICLDALPNLSWSRLPSVFQQINASLKPDGCFIGNYLSSENIDAHMTRKHGQLGYLRIYGRLLAGKMLARINPPRAGASGLLRTGTIFRDELAEQLAQFFTIEQLETGTYHWFVAGYRPQIQGKEKTSHRDIDSSVPSHQ